MLNLVELKNDDKNTVKDARHFLQTIAKSS